MRDSSDDEQDSDAEPPPLISITDDEHNILTRRTTSRTSQPHNAAAGRLIYEVRVAAHNSDSDSTHIYPEPDEESDEEHLPFWPERSPLYQHRHSQTLLSLPT